MTAKTLTEWQNEVDAHISQFKEGYFSPLSQVARLTEELGELSREVSHRYGEKPKKATEDVKTLEEETGDLFFVLITLANSLDIDLDEALQMVMRKFNSRDKNRWTKKEQAGDEDGQAES